MNNIINVSELFPSKASLAGIVTNLTMKVMDGEEDPIKQGANLDFIIKACTNAKDVLKPFIIEELEKDKTRTEYHGYKIEVSEAGVTYDYSNCNDRIYADLIKESEELKERIKAREVFLKSIKNSETLLDEESGEVIKIYPPVRKSTTTPKFTLK